MTLHLLVATSESVGCEDDESVRIKNMSQRNAYRSPPEHVAASPIYRLDEAQALLETRRSQLCFDAAFATDIEINSIGNYAVKAIQPPYRLAADNTARIRGIGLPTQSPN